MYEILSPDGAVLFEINYSEWSVRKWIVERYNKVDGRWIRSSWYRRFSSLDECRAAVDKVIKTLKIPTKTEP